MTIYIIMEVRRLPCEYQDTTVHSVVDSQEKAESFLCSNPDYLDDGEEVSYYFEEREVK